MPSTRHEALVRRLGIMPPVATVVRSALDDAIRDAESSSSRGSGGVAALDAGCGRVSQLRTFRDRIERMVGADIHAPSVPLPHLDEFAVADLCGPVEVFAPATFDVILSSFTLEHFADPSTALANMHAWLRGGGTLVATTVNRRHPFVAGYLGLPGPLRDRLQPLVKTTAADAHPLVGSCNDLDTISAALAAAGFHDIRLTTVGHLARAWARTWPTFALGLAGDVIAQRSPSRRSTIVVTARA